MAKKLSQEEIDALIAGMLSGEVDQATVDAALAGAGAEEEAAPVAAAEAAAPGPADPAVADGSQELIDLGPITQAEVDAALRAAGKGSLVASSAPAPGPGISEEPAAPAMHAMPEMPPAAPAPAPAPQPVARLAIPLGTASAILLDLELVLTAELVHTRMRLNQLLGLQPGAVLELDRPANEPVDIIINGHPMMKAKVVTMGENYGVQVTETRLQQPA